MYSIHRSGMTIYSGKKNGDVLCKICNFSFQIYMIGKEVSYEYINNKTIKNDFRDEIDPLRT